MKINELLHLTRPLVWLDTETTGVDTSVDRIVEIGFEFWEAHGPTKEWRSLIDPCAPIPAAAIAVHHITDAMVRSCKDCGQSAEHDNHHEGTSERGPHGFRGWPRFKDIAANLARGLVNCDFAGKNVRFDLRITAAEFAREGVPWSYLGARIIDADRLEQLGEPRTLSDLYRKHLGREPEDAHSALADARMSAEIVAVQLEKYSVLPRDLDALHQLQWPGWIDGEGKFRFVDGVPCVGQWGKHAGWPMRKVPSGYWDWLLKAEFSADVKTLAASAKLGKFPEMKR